VHKIKGGKLLRSDIIRLEVLKNEDIFDTKVAGDMKKRTQVYDVMFEMADEAAKSNRNIILDATFVTQSLRQRAAAIAARHKKTFVILQTDCPQEVSIRRILARDKENYVSNALTEEAYLNNKKKFEAVNLNDLKKQNPGLKVVHLIVDTAKDPPEDWYITGEMK
jgi:predicted kinase